MVIDLYAPMNKAYMIIVTSILDVTKPFWRSPGHGAKPLGLMCSHQSSHQCAQARPAHPLSPNFARHLRLANQAALRCQGEGRGGQEVVLLGAPQNENLESWDSVPGHSHAANVQVWNLAGRPSKTFFRGIQVLVTRGAVSSAVERSDSMFGSWR